MPLTDTHSFPSAPAVGLNAPSGYRAWLPPPALAGFVVLLAVLMAVSYAVGRGAEPVAPGMHRTVEGDPGTAGGTSGEGGTEPAMPGMHGGAGTDGSEGSR